MAFIPRGRAAGGVSDLTRPQLALCAVAVLVAVVLGVRHLRAGADAGGAAPAGPVPIRVSGPTTARAAASG